MTLYADIYGGFLNKITEYSFLSLAESDLEAILYKYLLNSISRFKRCKKDLSDRDDLLSQFNFDLDIEEQDILETMMLDEWIKPKIYNIELIKQAISSKDFQITSQANHLDKLIALRKELKVEISQKLSSYSYNKSNFDY
jgi:hypothetical protein